MTEGLMRPATPVPAGQGVEGGKAGLLAAVELLGPVEHRAQEGRRGRVRQVGRARAARGARELAGLPAEPGASEARGAPPAGPEGLR
jgi:hypothetical protein